ncbi:anhydro-N-acetylmuramic acid kinase [Luminiphilus syltensis NOR5-1B]|uniref:Anhydro-N-acetylmuramic acid kinase n=2 Tax=Luminiphilus TaxID=1341118 RepID=B8KW22_9GAMM|nr:anhydro-N-acetylmuramic acid kinase [Luminiphilus syltensis NOR5-1B]
MSGTSIDGIDAALIEIDDQTVRLVATHSSTYPASLQQQLRDLALPGDNEIDRMGVADHALADVLADAALAVIAEAGCQIGDIAAIGSHGQTIRHRPDGATPFTLQIGDPHRIAERTGCPVVADFRRRDMAAGGQGAPLAPLFHRALLAPVDRCSAVVNIGGIANVTVLDAGGRITGFDTGPGNTLMDAWIRKHRGLDYDEDGAWARTGQIDHPLLACLQGDPYFYRPPPKSTGPEYFNLSWLEPQLPTVASAEDIQRTLLELTASTVAESVAQYRPQRLAVCGGGAHNGLLMQRLSDRLDTIEVVSSEVLGLHPDWVEASAFAWLASQAISGTPVDAATVTGAEGPRILGVIYPP